MAVQHHNTGASIDAWHAIPDEYEDQNDWKQRLQIEPSKQIRLVELNHMRYQHVEIGKITQFLYDFGMQIAHESDKKIWWKGYGPHPYVYVVEKGDEAKYLGATFSVESYADLEKASKLEGASDIVYLDDSPGNGYMVTIYDPDGFPTNLIFGQSINDYDKSAIPERLLLNYEEKKERVGAFQRFSKGPAPVFRAGHYGICVEDFERSFDFYVRTFNLVPSDMVYGDINGERKDVASFIHIDRGEEYTDHHTFFIGRSPRIRVHHASYEIHDFDTQILGHQWLERKGYKLVWGVGRHLLGSQIFDYWWDTSGFMIEHYADGDIVNNKTKIGIASVSDEAMSVWGPDRPIGWIV